MSDQIDVNQLSNALQQKVDLPSGKSQADIDYVVEWQAPAGGDNFSWYRKYKSGWVEQGGFYSPSDYSDGSFRTITLPVTMANSNYTVQVSILNNENNGTNFYIKFCNRTTTSIQVKTGYGSTAYGYQFCWEVKGMSAQS